MAATQFRPRRNIPSYVSTCHLCGKVCGSAGALGMHLKKHKGETFIFGVQRGRGNVGALGFLDEYVNSLYDQPEDVGGYQDGDSVHAGNSSCNSVHRTHEQFAAAGGLELDEHEGDDYATIYHRYFSKHLILNEKLVCKKYLAYGARNPAKRLRQLPPEVLHAAKVRFNLQQTKTPCMLIASTY